MPVLSLCEAYLAKQAEGGRHHELTVARLSRREREIAELVVLGYTNAEIAVALGTSAYTVRNQLSSVFRKAHVSTRAELAGLVAAR